MQNRILYSALVLTILSVFLLGTPFCFGAEEDKGNNPDGYEALFTHGLLHDIEIVISQEEWDGLIQDMKDYAEEFNGSLQTGNYRKAKLIYRGPAGDTVMDEIGFRTKGRVSRVIPQDDNGTFHRAHFKVKFNEPFKLEPETEEYQQRDDRRFYRLRKLILRQHGTWDISQIRELYSYDLIRQAGAYTSRTGSARLTITIDGKQYYFGIYTLIEPIDKSFLTKRYGKDANDGNLYKCDAGGQSGPATLNSPDSYRRYWTDRSSFMTTLVGVKDWETNFRPTYDLKTNEDAEDHSALLDFIDNLNSLSGDELKQYLDDNFEVDRFLRYQAMNLLLGKWDDYSTMGNNYYLYFNNNGKIEFIPFDYDTALSNFSFFYSSATGIYEWGYHFDDFVALMSGLPIRFINRMFPSGSPLVEKIFEIDAYRQIYEGYFKEFITPSNKLFVYSDYEENYNQLHALYAPDLDNDIDEGEQMINEPYVREYFYERTQSVIDELGLNQEDYETKPVSLPPPTGVSATDGRFPFVIMITWDPVPYADYYRVYRSDRTDGTYVQISNDLTGTTFEDQPVAPDTFGYYRVKAFTTESVESDFSLEDAGSTNDGTIKAPTGVSATDGIYRHMITVSWEDVLNADYYRVYRSGSFGGPYEEISDRVRTLSFNDPSIEDNSQYYYKVKAFTDAGAETGFSLEDAGFTLPTGLSAPEIIPGTALVSGTYSFTNDNGTTTYTFNDDNTCTKSAPGPDGNTMEFTGEWGYEGSRLTIDTTLSDDLFGGMIKVRFIEIYENAFTLDNGSKLNLMGFKKTTGNQDGILGKYEGSASFHITVTTTEGGIIDEQTVTSEGQLTINDNMTVDMMVNVNGDIETLSGPWPGDDNQLIEFNGAYYLPPADEAVYTRQERACPIEMTLNHQEHLKVLRNLRDLRLRKSKGMDLIRIYDENAAEISAILAKNPGLKNKLRSLIITNMDMAEQLLDTGRVTIDKDIIKEIIAFLNHLKKLGNPKMKQAIDFVITGIQDGDLLAGINIGVQ